ncbi:Uncharacterised protein [Mycobacterium tuberculosis]|uniref:Uncharacterized protein n=1 Tax=Mycobacterium tuberculosis TaxID=1773 RepID=A0A0T7LFS8_MYCTX|nr:Uncharacterised protein [Mycobacterium tuberculosis]CFE81106.1 Uncharacterised protein [Mycobacterium tuberculosis]CFR68265.1 Uncharacterised protein [Mycobacterium tuberculosis]CFR97966.1 Uncharacterised protein [Mycobacterium tuberculosis]CFS03498.1 Uncharacterised protein [Mycobacterium tuberculosis]
MKFIKINASRLKLPRTRTGGNFESLAWPSSHITRTGWKHTVVLGCRSRNATCLLSFSGSIQ